MLAAVTAAPTQLGGVKCYPPLSDNRLVFLQPKAFLVDGVQPESWEAVRNGTATAATTATPTATATAANNRGWSGGSSDGRGSNSVVLKTTPTNTHTTIPLMRASREDEVRRFEPKERRPLVRSAPAAAGAATNSGTVAPASRGTGTQRSGATERLPMTKSRPQAYQVCSIVGGRLCMSVCMYVCIILLYWVLFHLPARWQERWQKR